MSVVLSLMLLSSGDKAWPPPTPSVELPGNIRVGAQLTPEGVAPAAEMCARETQWTSNGACQIVRTDGGEAGFNLVLNSGAVCEVLAEDPVAQDRRWVFDERGELRRSFTTNKATSKSSGFVFSYGDGRLSRIERWDDFSAKTPTVVESYAFDKNGNVIETTTQAEGASARRFMHVWYDKKIRMTTEAGTGIAWTYEYKGNLLSSVSERPGGVLPVTEHRYEYDKGRTSSVEKRIGPVRVSYTGYAFDKQGRLASMAIDDQGRPQLNLEAAAKGADDKELVVIPQRADGQYDRVTRYYYDCGWITRNPPEAKASRPTQEKARKPVSKASKPSKPRASKANKPSEANASMPPSP